MAFKFVFFVAVCAAQGFASPSVARRPDVCKKPSVEIPYEFDQAMHEMDEVRDTVSMAAMDAYSRGESLRVVLACFAEQSGNYIRLGLRVSDMVRDASLELSQKLKEKAERYAQLIEPPMKTIAVTVRELPEKVHNFIKEKQFLKAAQAVRDARKTVDENAKLIGTHIKAMAGEVPELADRAQELARGIHKEARETCEAINEAFRKCVEEGGPHNTAASEEDEDSSEE